MTNSALRARLRALGGRRASVRRPRRRDDVERDPARRARRHPLRDRARRAGGRRPARDRRRQPLRVLAPATTSPSGAARATAARSPSTSSPTRRSRRSTASSSSTTTTGSSGSRRSPSSRAATSSRPRRTSSRRRTSRCSTRYLAEGNPPDPPGRFLIWLSEREPVYGFRFDEEWLDIGDPEQLLEADNLYRGDGRPPARGPTTRRRSAPDGCRRGDTELAHI